MSAIHRAQPSDESSSELARVLASCNQRLQRAAPFGVAPVLRVQSGAGLIHGRRAQHVAELLEPMLALVAPRLYVPPTQSALAKVTIRPKVRVALRLGGAGLLAQCRYFGDAPAEHDLRSLYAREPSNCSPASTPDYALNAFNAAGVIVVSKALPGSVLALAMAPREAPIPAAKVLARGEICLQAVRHEAPRRWPLVRVMAGCREVAVPMFSVEQAICEDTICDTLPPMQSLAACLGEDPLLAPLGRAALLMLRRRGRPLALRVEALLGHGNEVVHPVGPLLQSAPWILGVIAGNDGGAPVLVVDPLTLPDLLAGSDTKA
jgi:hypothetical protein